MMIVNVARGARALARVSRFAARQTRARRRRVRRPRPEGIFHSSSRSREKVNCGGSPLAAMC